MSRTSIRALHVTPARPASAWNQGTRTPTRRNPPEKPDCAPHSQQPSRRNAGLRSRSDRMTRPVNKRPRRRWPAKPIRPLVGLLLLPVRIQEEVGRQYPDLPPKLGFTAGLVIQLFVAVVAGLIIAALTHIAGLR
jgi:hypothetical protein